MTALLCLIPWSSRAEPGKAGNLQELLPDLVLCGKKHESLYHLHKGRIDWEYPSDGPVLDVQPQPNPGTYLVTGGTGKVTLVRKMWKGFKVLWDWGGLEGVTVVSAVGADWDEKDRPTLVLAADAAGPRLFLADARSKAPKVRWDYKLTAPPRRAHLCTDNGDFLVTLADGTVEEIHFQEDKVVESLGKGDGILDAMDAVRDPWAKTYVADAGAGNVLCFGPKLQPLWKTHLPFAPGKPGTMALSLFRKGGKRLLLVSVHYAKGSAAQDVVYVLHSETGGVLAWSDKDEKGGYPSFTKAVPDRAEYLKKQ